MAFLDFGDFGPLIGDSAVPFALIEPGGVTVGTLVPDVTVEYTGRDETTIVNQPVQTGATITDHAFTMPSTLRLVMGWSNATNGAGPGYSAAWYQTALALAALRQPFTVTTPQRSYDNMLVAGISKSTSQEFASSLMLIVECQQIILVTIGGGTSGAVPQSSDPSQQAVPQSTQAPAAGGNVSSTSFAPATGVAALPGTSATGSFGIGGVE